MAIYNLLRHKYVVNLFYYGLTLFVFMASVASTASNYFQTDIVIIKQKTTDEDTLKQLITLSEAYWKTDKNKSDSLINLAFKLISKKETYNKSLMGDAYHILGKVLINKNKRRAGIDTLKTAIAYKQQIQKQDYTSIGITFNYIGIGFMGLNEFDSTIYYCTKSKQILFNNEIENINLYYAYLNIGIGYSRLGKVNHAINYFDSAYITLTHSEQANDSLTLASFYINFALVKTLTGQMKEANKDFEKAEAIIINKFGKSNINLAAINNNKGINAYFDYDFSKALLYYKKALDIYVINNTGKNKIPPVYYNLSQVSQGENDYLSSIDFCISGLEYNPENDLKLILNKSLAESYEKIGDVEKADTCFQIALRLLYKDNINPIRYHELYSSYAEFLMETNNELSIVYLLKALNSARELNGEESDNYAEILTLLGKYYLEVKKNSYIAIKYFKKAILVYKKVSGEGQIANNSIIEKTKAQVGYAEALLLKYHDTNDIGLLLKADTMFADELNKMNTVSNSLAYSDKLLLIEIANPIYNLAIENSYELLKLTNNEKFANKVFNYTERSKSAALLSAVNSEHALKTSDIPDQLFNYEHKLKDEINGLQQLLENEKTKEDPIVANISFFEKEILILVNKYDSLIVSIEEEYPKYYSVKYDTKTILPKQVKNHLAHDEAIVEYKLTDSILYVITITNDEFVVKKLDIDSNFYSSLKYIIDIKNVDLSQQNYAKFNEFKYHSNKLWKTLIEPTHSIIEDKRLIIIPDGILGYLPFDILIEHNTEFDSINYRDLPYLIRYHSLSYTYSATLKYNTYFNTNRDIPKNNLLAFAPLYIGGKSDNNSQLNPLPFAKKEAIEIVANRGGNLFVDKDATKANFLKYASSSNILHLAMHTIIDDSLPMQSRLVFYDDDDEPASNYMFTHELYNMNMNATMVVLSACNTGTGELKKGEGIMSLSRGFVYAGVPTIVMTLWEVQDASGTLIMNKYYDNLNEGKSKDVALQQAKLSVLSDANMAKSHPFFWATYIISGNTSIIDISKKNITKNTFIYYWILIISIVMTPIIIYYFKLRNTSANTA